MGNTLESVLIGIMLMVGTVGVFMVGLWYGSGEISLQSFSEPDNNGCVNLSLKETAFCLNNELKEFYYYNITNWKQDITLDELKIEGGVCWHYAKWYIGRAKSLGFDAEEVIFGISDKYSHSIAIMSTNGGDGKERGYCVLDQNFKPNCYKLSSTVP